MKRFHGESECPQCGCGSNDLKSEALPFIVTVLGKWMKLKCDICGRFWIAQLP